MNAKDYLESVRMVKIDIERTVGRIRRVEDQLEVHGIIYDGGSATREKGSKDRLTSEIVELLDYHDYLKAMQSYYIKQEKEADAVISAIGNLAYRRVVGLRYMDGLSYREIGKRMGYCEEAARKCCIRAVEHVDKFLIRFLQELEKVG